MQRIRRFLSKFSSHSKNNDSRGKARGHFWLCAREQREAQQQGAPPTIVNETDSSSQCPQTTPIVKGQAAKTMLHSLGLPAKLIVRGRSAMVSARRMVRIRSKLFALMLSICALVTLTALQLQMLVSQKLSVERREAIDPLVGKRRMQERFLLSRPRYLAVTVSNESSSLSSHQEPLYVKRLAESSLQVDWVQSQSLALSAACTQTIVGENSYLDVISIEYSTFDESLEILARRLRKRFPDALILLVEVWNPRMLRYRTSVSTLDWDNWRALAKKGTPSTRKGEWFLMDGSARQRVEALAREILNVKVVSLPKPNTQALDSPHELPTYLAWFQKENPEALSVSGQEIITRQIQSAISGAKPIVRSDKRGSWGSGDACNLWFTSGNYGGIAGRRIDFGSKQHHAIEFRHLRGDSVSVYNPFATQRMLYLTYMTALDDGIYPRARVRLNGAPTVHISPFHDEERDDHLARTTAVGMIPPKAWSTVQLDPLQSSTFSFRLVGASIVADEMRDVPIEFSLASEAVAKDERPKKYFGIW